MKRLPVVVCFVCQKPSELTDYCRYYLYILYVMDCGVGPLRSTRCGSIDSACGRLEPASDQCVWCPGDVCKSPSKPDRNFTVKRGFLVLSFRIYEERAAGNVSLVLLIIMAAAPLPPQLPRLKIGLLSEIWHPWMTPASDAAERGRVSAATLPRLPPEDSAPELLEQFELLWAKRHQVKAPSGDGKALGVTCSKLLYPRFQLSGLWNVLDEASNFSQPFIVATLVRDLRLADPATLGFDYGLVVLLTLSTFLSAAAIQQVLWNGARVGLRAKIALSGCRVFKDSGPRQLGVAQDVRGTGHEHRRN